PPRRDSPRRHRNAIGAAQAGHHQVPRSLAGAARLAARGHTDSTHHRHGHPYPAAPEHLAGSSAVVGLHDRYPLRILGVMKISSSRLESVIVLRWNSHLRIGTRYRYGVRSLVLCSWLTKMPPMTVVAPSLTCTVVSARCVSMGGMPLTLREKSGVAFSSWIAMITVFAVVICGVTCSFSVASLNDTATVLLATV